MTSSNSGKFVKPTFEEQTGILDDIFNLLEFTTQGPKHMAKRKLAFDSIVKAALSDEEHQVYWITNKEKWNYEEYPVSHICFRKVIGAMKAKNWISLIDGQTAKDGIARRWQVHDDLIELVHGLECEWIDLKPKRQRRRRPVEVRRSRLRNDLKLKGFSLPAFEHDKEAVAKLTEGMIELNNMMLEHSFEGLTDTHGEPFEFSGLYRVFNHTLSRGGRMYGGCEQTPKGLRKDIKIDGSRVVELDIRSSHPNILYSMTLKEHLPMEEAPSGQDFYQLTSDRLGGLLTRGEVKGIVTRAIGKGSLSVRRWPYGYAKPKVKWETEVLPAFLQVMPFLKLLKPIEMDGLRLQQIEAEFLFETVDGLYRHKGIPVLPIHDALLCREQDADTVMQCLRLSFWFKTGVVPQIRITQSLEVIE